MLRSIFACLIISICSCYKKQYQCEQNLVSLRYWDWVDLNLNGFACRSDIFPCWGTAFYKDYSLRDYTYMVVGNDTFRTFMNDSYYWQSIDDNTIVLLQSMDTISFSHHHKDTLLRITKGKHRRNVLKNYIIPTKFTHAWDIEFMKEK